jgi:hypothetical protein
MRFLWWLTGGRPMKRLDFRFVDAVDRQPVYRWVDKFGRIWLANNYDWFWRVRVPEDLL